VRRIRLSQGIIFALAGLILAVPKPAHAYVDPGSGAMIWQIAAATVIGSLFYVRRFMGWIKSRLGLGSTPAASDTEADRR
jgi:hypothetical protein